MSQVRVLDFTGQSIFCGIDIHKKDWAICLRTSDRELKTYSQNPDPQALIDYLNKNYPNASVSIVYEAGFCGFWPQQYFSQKDLIVRLLIQPMFLSQRKAVDIRRTPLTVANLP
jgi:transposase